MKGHETLKSKGALGLVAQFLRDTLFRVRPEALQPEMSVDAKVCTKASARL